MVILEVIGIVVSWFIVGFIINVMLYGHLPPSEVRETTQGRNLHYILNITTVILLLYVIFD